MFLFILINIFMYFIAEVVLCAIINKCVLQSL